MVNINENSKHRQNRLFLRAIIMCCCIAITAFFLYLPRLQEFFFRDNALYVYAFTEMISSESIKEFEEKYGIKVSIKNFESNEELLTKFRITGGEGYDLITPSDYMVELLQREGLLKKLDHSKLSVFDEIDPRLLNNYYDLNNNCSIPLAWVTYGVVFKKSIFKEIPKEIGFDLLFDESLEQTRYQLSFPYKICMVDDLIEAAFIASLHTGGDVKKFTDIQLQKIKKVLIAQKKWVECYLSHDIRQYLFSEVFHVAVTSSMNMKRILEDTDEFGFKIPKEGSLMVIENLAIPARCKKVELVYKFINFLLSKKISSLNSQMYGYNPTNQQAYAEVEEQFIQNPNFFPDEETFSRLHLIHNDIPLKKLEEIWLEVKNN